MKFWCSPLSSAIDEIAEYYLKPGSVKTVVVCLESGLIVQNIGFP